MIRKTMFQAWYRINITKVCKEDKKEDARQFIGFRLSK